MNGSRVIGRCALCGGDFHSQAEVEAHWRSEGHLRRYARWKAAERAREDADMPLVKGGQGRTDEEMVASAEAFLWVGGVLLAALAVVLLVARLGGCAGEPSARPGDGLRATFVRGAPPVLLADGGGR